MGYDPEKYREKREKVLGIKKRGFGFGTIAGIVSFLIIAGLGAVTVPQAISYISDRHLDDAIFKFEAQAGTLENIDNVADALDGVKKMDGVKKIKKDKNGTRLVVTYDRRQLRPTDVQAFLTRHMIKAVLLNQVSHMHNQTESENKEKEHEAP